MVLGQEVSEVCETTPEQQIARLEQQLKYYREQEFSREQSIRHQAVQQVYTHEHATSQVISRADELVNYILAGAKPIKQLQTSPPAN